MPQLNSLQTYLELGLLIVGLIVLVPLGWLTSGYGIKLLNMIFARQPSRMTLLGSRAAGGVVGAIAAFMLWSGFGGHGVPGPGGSGYPPGDGTSTVATPLTDKTMAVTNPGQPKSATDTAKPLPSGPAAITTDGKRRQVRIAVLGRGTQPRYALDNRFFLLLDSADKTPLTAEELIGKLQEWHADQKLDQVILYYTTTSADPDTHPEIKKLRDAVARLGIRRFAPEQDETGKWIP